MSTGEVMTVQEVADYLRVHPSSIYRMLKAKTGPAAFRIGSDWRFRRVSVDEWIKRTETGKGMTRET